MKKLWNSRTGKNIRAASSHVAILGFAVLAMATNQDDLRIFGFGAALLGGWLTLMVLYLTIVLPQQRRRAAVEGAQRVVHDEQERYLEQLKEQNAEKRFELDMMSLVQEDARSKFQSDYQRLPMELQRMVDHILLANNMGHMLDPIMRQHEPSKDEL